MRRFLLLLALLGFALSPLAGRPETATVQAASPHQIVSVTGYTQSATYGTRFDLTLDVPPGADSNALGQAALARRGARPATASGAAPAGVPILRWPQFFDHDHTAVVPQSYNPAGDPTPGGAAQALQSTEQAWTNVHIATFALQYVGTTTRGAAVDGVNTVSWATDLDFGPDTLAVTTTFSQPSTGFILDADVQLNSQFQWFANPADLTPTRVDVREVLLHENGHVAGLGHSSNPAAVMFPSFSAGIVGHGLSSIDSDALARLYPLGQGTPQQPPRKLQDFSATYTGSIAFTSATTAAFTGSGTGTYVGQSQVKGSVFAQAGTVACPGASFDTAHFDTITAANGDLLYLVASDVTCETPPGSQVYHSVGSFTIVDGTGRFVGALGRGTLDSHSDFTTHAFSITYAGTVAP